MVSGFHCLTSFINVDSHVSLVVIWQRPRSRKELGGPQMELGGPQTQWEGLRASWEGPRATWQCLAVSWEARGGTEREKRKIKDHYQYMVVS